MTMHPQEKIQIPLPLAPMRQSLDIVSVIGKPATISKLSSIGVIPNTSIEIIQSVDNNLVIRIGSSRIAMATSLAQKIIVQLS